MKVPPAAIGSEWEELDALAWRLFEEIQVEHERARTEAESEALTMVSDGVLAVAALSLQLAAGRRVGTLEQQRLQLALRDALATRAISFPLARRVRQLLGEVGKIRLLAAREEHVPPTSAPPPAGIYVPAAALHQVHSRIFPCEKMFVASARNYGGDVRRIESTFDVTGRGTATHVEPDPELLAQAQIIMSRSDSYFGGWLHSHPGDSPANTWPSHTDLGSYRERRRQGDSEWLVGAIFAGSYLRFWGDRADAVRVTGAGVRCLDQREHLYELIF